MNDAPRGVTGLAGLYLHVPYCSAVCPYCDFAVSTARPAVRSAFVDTLIAEVGLWSDWATPIDTIYLGGGTPSILSPPELARILAAVRRQLPVVAGARTFLEANPEDVDVERGRAWRALGIETLSLGVQSFEAEELRALGRRHDPVAAEAAVRAGLAAGFSTVSVDLMFGLPGQSVAAWRRSLEAVVALFPQHVSCYQLTIHEGTPFARRRANGRLREMPEPDQAAMFDLTHEVLGNAGWEAYEVSNFARAPEHRSQHNQKYWRHAPYLGLGPSAHSFDGERRWWNERDAAAYSRRVHESRRPIDGEESLADDALALEVIMLGLRTTDGIDLGAYRRRFGVDLIHANRALVTTLVDEGLLHADAARLAPTRAGLAVADGLSARIDAQTASGGRGC